MANFITLLLERIGADIKPYANMLVRLLFPVVKDEKSTTAKRAFASACAKVLNYITTSQGQKLIEDTVALHADDRSSQIACAFLLKSYSSMASDVVRGYLAVIIPVVFVSRFELIVYIILPYPLKKKDKGYILKKKMRNIKIRSKGYPKIFKKLQTH